MKTSTQTREWEIDEARLCDDRYIFLLYMSGMKFAHLARVLKTKNVQGVMHRALRGAKKVASSKTVEPPKYSHTAALKRLLPLTDDIGRIAHED